MAKRAVRAIVRDMTGRRGFRQNWEQIDRPIQKEIEAAWEKAIDNAFEMGPQPKVGR